MKAKANSQNQEIGFETPSDKSLGGFSLSQNQKISPQDIPKMLVELGYESVGSSQVHQHGQFSRRGGIVDIWLERYKLPARVDLIGDKIEAIYLYNSITQEKAKSLIKLFILPYKSTPTFAPTWAKKQLGKYERLFLSEIEKGDLVVHIDHGIGKFLAVEYREIEKGAGRTYLILEYSKGDKLYVPVEQIERVTKYIGSPGRKSVLSYLGTESWERTKQKVKESIVETARELLSLYAKREIVKRAPFGSDTPWQSQLEDSFEFTETEDQIRAIAEIKKDLESSHPMDRLLVGDVGFGKTEVAVRAAFKVVQDGKQVAVLVPTTILAEQHYHLFKKRLEKFPVEIEMLSRFRDEEAQKKILGALKIGKLDIVVGTHRLLSKDTEFKNLGLLIIDEEHRFGVAAKERLKNTRDSVDVLSMSATPIPRTLQMALTKIRDSSTLSEPPSGRVAVETFVGEYDSEKIKDVVAKEISRGGQVYYVYNRVERIAAKTKEVQELVPNAKIVYAHGQMDRRIQNSGFRAQNLEKVMEEFYSGNADVLVCTTIIGSGLDMPNVNSIIIENAEKFGLSDLYQLRGRVGRSERQAFAYLFYPKGFVPDGDSLERLATMAEATELGAGFKIAKKDLEIRGAGNLLGVAQSGNIALVGFELYVQLLSQAVEQLKSS
ncbi:MAG: DEAD/DEAH box helicase [Candidatus Woykebacteria bacterium]